MKLENILVKYAKKTSGVVLGFNVTSEKLNTAIIDNKKVIKYDNVSYNKNKFFGDDKTKKRFRIKKITIKKMRRVFKRKKIDYIFCDYDFVKRDFRHFVRNSVYINNKKLYLYGTSTNIDLITKKYSRYNTKIDIAKEEDFFIISIDNSQAKTSFFKDKLYGFIDIFTKTIDVIGEFLIS